MHLCPWFQPSAMDLHSLSSIQVMKLPMLTPFGHKFGLHKVFLMQQQFFFSEDMKNTLVLCMRFYVFGTVFLTYKALQNRKWLEMVMKDLVKESDPSRQMDAILTSLHSYASSPADLNENDIGKIEVSALQNHRLSTHFFFNSCHSYNPIFRNLLIIWKTSLAMPKSRTGSWTKAGCWSLKHFLYVLVISDYNWCYYK